MKNLVWLVVAALIALAGYMLFTGKGPQEVAIEASDAINAPALAEDATQAAEEAADAITDTVDAAGEAISDAVDDATESANDAAEPAAQN
ncbi:hypothetical protein K3759_08880 [Sulfitobacter sp. W027]|jgi:hypothetical protein|uniref:hypothetical protein n=1 Tax=Sulfitobacter sp. W027 TaxID=2867025 RepID=UPI0021A82B93|nr:hypothetical protein [Sulfitobacter sp. W027]UWR32087.1 hypothetical protein K3759_08880 [Sulfitobacter sp. W027]